MASTRRAKFEELRIGADGNYVLDEIEADAKDYSYEDYTTFKFKPYIHNNSHLTTESYGDVSFGAINIYLVHATRIPVDDESKIIIHLWKGDQKITPCEKACQLKISSTDETSYSVKKKLTGTLVVTNSEAYIKDIKVDDEYSSISLPLLIEGDVTLPS